MYKQDSDEKPSPRSKTSSIKLEYVPVVDKKDGTKTKLVLAKCIREVNFNLGLGAISLPNKRLTSIEGLGVQKGLERLYLQNNYLENFEYLEVQPRMKELRMENNRISTLKGLQPQPNLVDIWLKGNPICVHPLYRIMCLLVVGKSLRKVDGEAFSQIERLQASQCNPKIAKALSLGWLLDYQERTDSEYDALINSLQKGIKIEQPSFGKVNEAMIKERDDHPKVSFVFREPPTESEANEEEGELDDVETSSQQEKNEVVEEKPKTPPAEPKADKKPKLSTSNSASSQQLRSTIVNKQPQGIKAYEDQISDLKNIVKTLAENLQTEHVKVSNLERELFEKEETMLLLEDEKHRVEEELKRALNEERQQRRQLEEKLQNVLQIPKVIDNQQLLTGEMLSNMDTIQFYPMVESKNQDKVTVLKSGCVSFNNTGINVLVTPTEMFSLEFGEPVKISKDSGKRLVIEKATGKHLTISDPRRDLIAFCIENWLKYKK